MIFRLSGLEPQVHCLCGQNQSENHFFQQQPSAKQDWLRPFSVLVQDANSDCEVISCLVFCSI